MEQIFVFSFSLNRLQTSRQNGDNLKEIAAEARNQELRNICIFEPAFLYIRYTYDEKNLGSSIPNERGNIPNQKKNQIYSIPKSISNKSIALSRARRCVNNAKRALFQAARIEDQQIYRLHYLPNKIDIVISVRCTHRQVVGSCVWYGDEKNLHVFTHNKQKIWLKYL